jgi:hypothetical protein
VLSPAGAVCVDLSVAPSVLLQLPGLAREVANRRRACASHLIFAALREARRRKGVNGERYTSAAKHWLVLILSMISLLNLSRANHPRSPWTSRLNPEAVPSPGPNDLHLLKRLNRKAVPSPDAR